MNNPIDLRKTWQQIRWIQVLAIVLGYALPLMVFISQLGKGAITAQKFLPYAIVCTLIVIAVLPLLLRFLCGERPKELNRKTGPLFI